MGKYRKILVAVDGSESSRNALTQAFRFAVDEKCWITVTSVVPPYEGEIETLGIKDIKAALAGEYRTESGASQRYVYVELARGAQIDKVKTALAADPAFAGEETLVFPVESIAAIEEEGHGMVLTRRGSAKSGAHQSLLLEGRFAALAFAARAMLEGVAQLPELRAGAHRFALRG